jgi:hypothetical protein
MFRPVLFALVLSLVPALSAAQGCQTVRFAPGSSSGAIEGVSPPEDVLCYRIEVGNGQRARVRISGTNMMFSIRGLVDARDDYAWTTSAGSYDIIVGQLMRSVTEEPFTLVLSVTGG